MSSVNTAIFSVQLTDKQKPEGEALRRLATYSFYDGRSKATAEAFMTVVAYGKAAEQLKGFNAGPVVVEGRIAIGEPKGDNKDRPLELIASRFHL